MFPSCNLRASFMRISLFQALHPKFVPKVSVINLWSSRRASQMASAVLLSQTRRSFSWATKGLRQLLLLVVSFSLWLLNWFWQVKSVVCHFSKAWSSTNLDCFNVMSPSSHLKRIYNFWVKKQSFSLNDIQLSFLSKISSWQSIKFSSNLNANNEIHIPPNFHLLKHYFAIKKQYFFGNFINMGCVFWNTCFMFYSFTLIFMNKIS